MLEQPFTVAEMMAADEVFFTSCSALCCRIREIDGAPVGGKDEALIRRIQRAAQDEVDREIEAFAHR